MRTYRIFGWLALAAATLALAPRPAEACGNVTHAWITFDALDKLPEGTLRDLLSTPAAERALRNGTMFPDGGYAIGDDYAEISHWEPFQDRYLGWIRANFEPPWNDEAAEHIAFLLGMASHGMADQVYDATFMEASKAVDHAWDTCRELLCSFDTATDFLWVSHTGPQPLPERRIPEALFPPFFHDAGHVVSEDRLLEGTDQVRRAIAMVNLLGSDESILDTARADFPWGAAHLDDPGRGAPRNIGPIVAAYWQVLWERLHGGDWVETPVLATIPADGSYGHARDHRDVAARVSVVFSRGLRRAALDTASFHLTDSQGREHPFRINLFYREASHVVNVHPEEDFAENETYTLSVEPGITGFDRSESTAPFSFTFHTTPPPRIEPQPPEDENQGCDCATTPPGAMTVLALLLVRRRGAR